MAHPARKPPCLPAALPHTACAPMPSSRLCRDTPAACRPCGMAAAQVLPWGMRSQHVPWPLPAVCTSALTKNRHAPDRKRAHEGPPFLREKHAARQARPLSQEGCRDPGGAVAAGRRGHFSGAMTARGSRAAAGSVVSRPHRTSAAAPDKAAPCRRPPRHQA